MQISGDITGFLKNCAANEYFRDPTGVAPIFDKFGSREVSIKTATSFCKNGRKFVFMQHVRVVRQWSYRPLNIS